MRFLFLVAVAVGLTVTSPARAEKTAPAPTPTPPSNVNVVNTPTVNVGTMPAVTVQGTPSVQVTSLPAVQVSSLPAVQLDPSTTVQIGNTAPILTRDADRSANTPFLASWHVHVDLNAGSAYAEIQVPAGRRMVIEYIAAMGIGAQGTSVFLTPQVATTMGNGTGYIPVPLNASGATGLAGGATAKLYADPGASVGCIVYSSSAADFNCTVSGYLTGP
jgi:hypothetical protein